MAGPEFCKLEDHILLVKNALYGLSSSMLR